MDHAVIRTASSPDFTDRLPARIASIVVGGNFSASSIAAGVAPGVDGQYGTMDDVVIGSRTDAGGPTARIGAVAIGGRALGTPAAGDHYGIVAEQIVSAKLRGRPLKLTTGPHNDSLSLDPAGEVTLREV
jgi:hypothetical protein